MANVEYLSTFKLVILNKTKTRSNQTNLTTSLVDVGVVAARGLILAVEFRFGDGVEDGVIGSSIAWNFAAHHGRGRAGRLAVDADLHFGSGLRVQFEWVRWVLPRVTLGLFHFGLGGWFQVDGQWRCRDVPSVALFRLHGDRCRCAHPLGRCVVLVVVVVMVSTAQM